MQTHQTQVTQATKPITSESSQLQQPASPHQASASTGKDRVTITPEDALRAQQAKAAAKAHVVSPTPDELPLDDESVSEKPVDQAADTLDSFERKISFAGMQGHAWVETSENVIKTLNPRGLGTAKYFIYKNIKVCLAGQAREIQNEEANRRHEGAADA